MRTPTARTPRLVHRGAACADGATARRPRADRRKTRITPANGVPPRKLLSRPCPELALGGSCRFGCNGRKADVPRLACGRSNGVQVPTGVRSAARTERCPGRATARGPHPRDRASSCPQGRGLIGFDGVSKVYDGGDTGLSDASFNVRRGEFVFLVGSTGSGKSTIMNLLIKERDPTGGTIRVAGRTSRTSRAARSRTTGATSGSSSRTSSCCPTGRCTTTSRTRCRPRARRARRSARRCPTSCASPGSGRSCTTTPTSSPAASSSACRSRARSSTTRRCCSPTSRPATSTRNVAGDHAAAVPDLPHRHDACSSRRTTRTWSTACAAASSSCARPDHPRRGQRPVRPARADDRRVRAA